MAGKTQHFIPQSLLRCFRVPGKGSSARVWVFPKEREAFCTVTDGAAAENYFYSRPAVDGSVTLDDRITAYESTRLDGILKFLRASADGADVDSAQAAELVAHLTVRNAHVRESFALVGALAVERMAEAFGDEDYLRRLVGADSGIPTTLFREAFEATIKQHSWFKQSNVPLAVIEQIAITLLAENHGGIFGKMSSAATALRDATHGFDEVARTGHNRALDVTFLPAQRIASLGQLRWTVVAVTDGPLILPDCVALGRAEEESQFLPLILVDSARTTVALMPLQKDKLLLGCRAESPTVDLKDLNHAFAACSQTFFIASTHTPELEAVAVRIGTRSRSVAEAEITEAIQESGGTLHLPAQLPTQHQPETPLRERQSFAYEVTCRDCADTETAKRIAAAVGEIVKAVVPENRLERLDGFTFADDYAASLRELDRGYEASGPPAPRDDELGIGIAQAPLVIRNGVIKARIVMRGAIGRALIGDEEAQWQLALQAVVHQLLYVVYIQKFDEQIPGVLLGAIPDEYEAMLFAHTWYVPGMYFAARGSATINDTCGDRRQQVTGTLERALQTIPQARSAHQTDDNLDALASHVLRTVADILGRAADLLGQADALGQSAVDPELSSTLDKCGLRPWLDRLHADLQRLWNTQAQWTALGEFLVLNRSAERVLWQFGLIPWRCSDGVWFQIVPMWPFGR